MLCRQHNRGCAEDRIDARGEDPDLFVAVFDRKIDIGTFTPTNPIALALQNLFRPASFDLIDVSDKLFRIVRNLQEPLFKIALLDYRSASPTDSTRRLFVRKDRLFLRAPVNLRNFLISQASLQHLQKEPLVPLVVVRTVGCNFTTPVVADPQTLQLPSHMCDVVFCPVARVHTTLDRCLFRRLTETVPTNRMQDIEALQTLEPGKRVAYGVVADVTHVQEPGRVRQHFKRIELWTR